MCALYKDMAYINCNLYFITFNYLNDIYTHIHIYIYIYERERDFVCVCVCAHMYYNILSSFIMPNNSITYALSNK